MTPKVKDAARSSVNDERETAREAAKRIRKMSKGVTLSGARLKDLINEGRR